MSAGLRLSEVTVQLAGKPLIEGLSLDVAPGEIVTLMGESGVGKSTLLAFICGTLDINFTASGQVWVDAQAITALPPEARQVGILFQDDLLFPHLSVGDNLAFGLKPEIRGKARQARVLAALEEAELAGFADRDPATLSGGQRARVALMRTLLAEPRVILLDEPFSKLDTHTRGRFREFVFAHIRQHRVPALMVTHDPQDAQATGGAVIELHPPPPAGDSAMAVL